MNKKIDGVFMYKKPKGKLTYVNGVVYDNYEGEGGNAVVTEVGTYSASEWTRARVIVLLITILLVFLIVYGVIGLVKLIV